MKYKDAAETMYPLGFYKSAGNAPLLKSGQLTSYGSGTGLDDGALQLGLSKLYDILTTGQYAGATNITINGKTDVHSNACVVDLRTKKMWSRTVSASVGPASNGLLPWTTTGSGATAEGIFPYVVAANAAGLAGYGDWGIPNAVEGFSLMIQRTTDAYPDPIAFPSFPSGGTLWCSTTRGQANTNAFNPRPNLGDVITLAKSSTAYVMLVRG